MAENKDKIVIFKDETHLVHRNLQLGIETQDVDNDSSPQLNVKLDELLVWT